jgi:integrase
MTNTLPPGVSRESGRSGFLVTARVRPYPLERERFTADTPLAVMTAWRTAKIDELQQRRRELERAAAPVVDVLAPRPRRSSAVTTLRDDVELYLAEKINPNLHPCTRLQFERWLRKAAATDLGRLPRQLITGGQWAALLAQWERSGIPVSADDGALKADGTRRRPKAPTSLAVDTVHKIRTCWIGFYEAMNAGQELPNPARRIPRRQLAEIVPRSIPFTAALEIVAHVGRSGAPTKTKARLELMILLGLRPVEIMKIKPERDWRKAERELVVRTAKRGKPRVLDLSDGAVAALEALEALKGWGTFTSAPAARMFHDAVVAAGHVKLEPLRPYDLRHSFGTEAYRLTGDLKAVGEALGQRNLKTTERYVEGAVSGAVAKVCAGIARVTPKPKRRRGQLRAVDLGARR